MSMRNVFSIVLLLGAVTLTGCHNSAKVTEQGQGQQYRDGTITQDLKPVAKINTEKKIANSADYLRQVDEIASISPRLYGKSSYTYFLIANWLNQGGDLSKLPEKLTAYQMKGTDNYGNVLFTGYYTPVLEARRTPSSTYKYPIYATPKKNKRFERSAIYNGVLNNKGLELAYSSSLIDNFMMEVQGSSYIDFCDGSPLNFFAFAGKNGYAYTSVGRILVERGHVEKEKISMQAIRDWVAQNDENAVKELLSQNRSFVYFTPKGSAPVKGASGIPLIALASVAADKRLVPPGSVLLAEVPLLTENGEFSGEYALRLMVALDVGGAIKGHHFDLYQGIGKKAAEVAGYYNHFGRVWLLSSEGDALDSLRKTGI